MCVGDYTYDHGRSDGKNAKKKRPGLEQYQDAMAALPQNCLTTSGFYVGGVGL
jgi:hypothetical protein